MVVLIGQGERTEEEQLIFLMHYMRKKVENVYSIEKEYCSGASFH